MKEESAIKTARDQCRSLKIILKVDLVSALGTTSRRRIHAERNDVSKTTSLLTRRRLDEIADSPATLAQLQRHAERRLARARRSLPEGALQQLDGEDLVQEALVETFVGTLERKRGRHPRSHHLSSQPHLTRWLQSVLNSLVANLRASAAARARRIQLEGAFELVCPAPNAREVADFCLRMVALLTELRREFAHRPVILALLCDWERDSAHLDRLPGKPFNAHVVRQAVRRILRRRPELRP